MFFINRTFLCLKNQGDQKILIFVKWRWKIIYLYHWSESFIVVVIQTFQQTISTIKTNTREKVYNAFLQTVNCQIWSWKKRHPWWKEHICSVLQLLMTKETSFVQHYLVSFELFDQFIAEQNLTINDIKFDSQSFSKRWFLYGSGLIFDWRNFHLKHAHLCYASRTALIKQEQKKKINGYMKIYEKKFWWRL